MEIDSLFDLCLQAVGNEILAEYQPFPGCETQDRRIPSPALIDLVR